MASKTLPSRPIAAELPSTARVFVFEPQRPPRWVALKQEAALGRVAGAKNAIVLDDARVSSAHARMHRDRNARGWIITDSDSTNGTIVDGVRVTQAPLVDGTVIRLGDTLLVFESGHRPAHGTAPHSTVDLLLSAAVRRVAAGDAPVLILGPTGAGKGHLAQQISDASARTGRVVHVNCAALPASLIEAELFGHARGAFTGASAAKPGLVEEADGGTLFLDEIGTLPPELQATLLVAVEEGRVRRVGETSDRRVNVRYLAATNLDVKAAIADGSFREDLYYRLAAHTVELPPLRERRADILRLFADAVGETVFAATTAELREALVLWDWPGNVRELLNVGATLSGFTAAEHDAEHDAGRDAGQAAETALDFDVLPEAMTAFLTARATGNPLSARPKADHTTLRPGTPRTADTSPSEVTETSGDATGGGTIGGRAPTRDVLVRGLEAAGGNVSALARQLGEHRNQVVRWLDAYGLRG